MEHPIIIAVIIFAFGAGMIWGAGLMALSIQRKRRQRMLEFVRRTILWTEIERACRQLAYR